jgi:hypothetical protein
MQAAGAMGAFSLLTTEALFFEKIEGVTGGDAKHRQ